MKRNKGAIRLQIFLAVSPAEAQAASGYHRPLAHAAYRIGNDSSLLRRNLPLQAHGGLLCISDRHAPPITNPTTLCQGVLRECHRRSYQGVLLDFEETPGPDRIAFISQLEHLLLGQRKTLYLPEYCMDAAPKSIGLICTALSGGTFEQRLRDAIAHRGSASRLALDVQRLCMDFTLPCKSGEGSPLSREQFKALVQQERPSFFFSPELCTRYFTYTKDNAAHFVLFDDAETLRQKLNRGTGLGFSAAFFMWPEIQDLAHSLFR